MAHRGTDTLRFGPMKPVGLVDPRTGRTPYAVVQLRQDNIAGDHYSLVGFQTQLKWGEQARVLRMIPGLEQAEFVRFGIVHRNTYINGPTVLRPTWQVKSRDDLFFAGQISGVEGYVESAASGLIAGLNAAAVARGEAPRVPPRETAIGALAHYVSHADPRHYQPTNITFGIMPPLSATRRPAAAAAARPIARRRPPSARSACSASGSPRRPRSAARDVTTELRAFLDHLGLNRNASAHTVDAYASDIAQFLAVRGAGAAGARPRSCGPRSSTSRRSARSWPSSTAWATRGRRCRASSRRCARSGATCAVRG